LEWRASPLDNLDARTNSVEPVIRRAGVFLIKRTVDFLCLR
jgi:hypothetical protein